MDYFWSDINYFVIIIGASLFIIYSTSMEYFRTIKINYRMIIFCKEYAYMLVQDAV